MQRKIGLSGNTSGSLDRASALEKARLKEKQAFEEKKRELEIRRQKSSFNYGENLFQEVSHQEDEKESTKTIIIKDSDNNNISSNISKTGNHEKKSKSKGKIKRKLLSFEKDEDNNDDNSESDNDNNNNTGDNGEENRRKKKRRKQEGDDKGKDDEEGKKKSLKNPSVRTDFLPDKERDLRELELREQLKQEWLAEQEKIKKEQLEVVYSWWDGSGHRRKVQVSKGTTILQFLSLVKTQLAPEFRDVERVHTNDLMYIKEDLIIPNNYSFYDLIITKARGKSGPLFHFDVHEDVRLKQDVRVEKDESHPGKVCDRRWYERNKHIFPYNRWETYDPSKTFDKYTIHGGIVNKTKK